MDPITIIVTALVAGAAAGLKPTAAQAVKDAYAGLKTLIQRKYASVSASVDQLEASPESKARRNVVEEDLGNTSAAQDRELLEWAQAALQAVATYDPDAARVVGVSLEDIKGASLKVRDILAQGPGAVVGVSIKKAEIGDIEISGVKAIGGGAMAPPLVQASPRPAVLKILFLAANPAETTRLRLDEEVRAIDHALRMAEFRDRFDLEQHWAVRVGDLQELLLRHQPHIVHFSGHGSSAGEILLEDEAGRAQPVSPRALSATFGLLKDNIRVVVLNACYSEIQAKAIADHVDCVVGMSTAVGDRAAISFAKAFYRALGFKRDVKTAFELGCAEIDLHNLNDQETPKLHAPRCDPAQVRLIDDPKA